MNDCTHEKAWRYTAMTRVALDLLKGRAHERLVYLSLSEYTRNDTRTVDIGIPQICAESGIQKTSVKAALQALERNGLIKAVRGRTTASNERAVNRYVLTSAEDLCALRGLDEKDYLYERDAKPKKKNDRAMKRELADHWKDLGRRFEVAVYDVDRYHKDVNTLVKVWWEREGLPWTAERIEEMGLTGKLEPEDITDEQRVARMKAAMDNIARAGGEAALSQPRRWIPVYMQASANELEWCRKYDWIEGSDFGFPMDKNTEVAAR